MKLDGLNIPWKKITKDGQGFDVDNNQPNLNGKQMQFDWIVTHEFLTNGDKKKRIRTLRGCFLIRLKSPIIRGNILNAKSENNRPQPGEKTMIWIEWHDSLGHINL